MATIALSKLPSPAIAAHHPSPASLENLPVELMQMVIGQGQVSQRDVLAMRLVSSRCKAAMDAVSVPEWMPRMGPGRATYAQSISDFLRIARFASSRVQERNYKFFSYGLGDTHNFFPVDDKTCLVLCGNGRLVQGSLSPGSALFEEVAPAGSFSPSMQILDAVRSVQKQESYRLLCLKREGAFVFVACARDGSFQEKTFPLRWGGFSKRDAAFDHTGLFAVVEANRSYQRYYLGGDKVPLLDGRLELMANGLELSPGDDVAQSAATGDVARFVVTFTNNAAENNWPGELQGSTRDEAGMRRDWTLSMPWAPTSLSFSPDGRRLGLLRTTFREGAELETATLDFNPRGKGTLNVDKRPEVQGIHQRLLAANGVVPVKSKWMYSTDSGWLLRADWRPEFWGQGAWSQTRIRYPGIQMHQRWVGMHLERGRLIYQTVLHDPTDATRHGSRLTYVGAALMGLVLASSKITTARTFETSYITLCVLVLAQQISSGLMGGRGENVISLACIAAALEVVGVSLLSMAQLGAVELTRRSKAREDTLSATQQQDLCTLPLPRVA